MLAMVQEIGSAYVMYAFRLATKLWLRGEITERSIRIGGLLPGAFDLPGEQVASS